ncbi:MAG: hypothetical protein Kow0010_16800 [Dehalococcoidia bacterium]
MPSVRGHGGVLARLLAGAVVAAATFGGIAIFAQAPAGPLDADARTQAPQLSATGTPTPGAGTIDAVAGSRAEGGEREASAQQAPPPPPVTPTPAPAAEPPPPATVFVPLVSNDGVAPPPPPPIDPAFAELEARLAEAIDGFPVAGIYAIAVTDLQTGHTIGVNADRRQLSGCVANYFAILAVLSDVQAGAYELERVDALIRATIRTSNATTARELYRIAGDGDVLAGVAKAGAIANVELGLDDIVLDHPPGYYTESLGIDADNWITAAAINEALAALYHGDVPQEPLRSYLLEAMEGVYWGLQYLTASTPGGTVSHKNGFFPQWGGGWVDNDAGIVRFERGGTEYAYAVTFLSQDVPVRLGDIPLAQQLMRMTWEYFDQRYPG